MTAATSSAVASSLTVHQQRVLEALRPFLGHDAASLYEAHGQSLHKLTGLARGSSLPGYRSLVTGLELAQALLVEQLAAAPVFQTPTAVADDLKLHFAGQMHESFAVLFLECAAC